MLAILIYSLISSALYYLGSRAMITRWLWSRYPSAFARFMDCAACTGFWFGFFTTNAFNAFMIAPDLGLLYGNQPAVIQPWIEPLIVGLITLVTTPIIAGFMQRGLDSLGSTVADEDSGQHD